MANPSELQRQAEEDAVLLNAYKGFADWCIGMGIMYGGDFAKVAAELRKRMPAHHDTHERLLRSLT